MKKLLYVISFVFVAGSLAAQSIPHGDFESWMPLTWMDPSNYSASNDQYVPTGYSADVIRNKTAYHGSYAVQLTTTKMGSDTLQAYFANGNPGGSKITGGIPYKQKPTGMRFYYSCDIKAGDTGLVLAVFKLAGNVIGNYVCKLTGNVGTYTLYTKTFTPALLLTPDTVIFGATPSNLLTNNNFRGIPGSMLIIDSVTFTGVASQPALLNGDFENWTADTADYPTGWSGSYPGVYKTSDKYAGTSVMELKTSGPTQQNNQAQPAYATTGQNSNNGLIGGYPYTQQVDTLSFYYKYTPVGNDTGDVSLEFKKSGAVVGYAGSWIFPQASYTLMKVPFNVGSVPDSVIVFFQSTLDYNNANAHVGTTLKVDNVQFASSPLLVNNIQDGGAIRIYPNPVKDVFYFDAQKLHGSVQGIAIYDLNGKLIQSVNYPFGARNAVQSVNMSNCAPGMYMLKVITGHGIYYQKISKVE